METPQETLARARQLTATQPTPSTTTKRKQPSDKLVALSVANSPQPAPIQSPVTADMVQPQPDVALPEPQAPGVQEAFVTSLADNLAVTRNAYETTLKTRRDEIATETANLTKERDKMLEGPVKDNLTPFRQELENKDRERLYIDQNFEANQRLTNELDTLLTEGNNLIKQMQGIPAANRIVNARVMNAMNDVNARAGVIQAVMNARNAQISQAYTMIDRTTEAITADRNDQLTYYQALLDVKERGLLTLSKEDEKLANEQLSLAREDIDRAQATADYIKKLMIDPNTATLMANAGVTMLDSVEDINGKIADTVKRQEVEAFTNELTSAGYIVSPVPIEGAESYDINGQTIYAKVRPGSMLDLERQGAQLGLEATRTSIAAQRASIANSNASAARTRTLQLIDLAEAGNPEAIAQLGITPSDGSAASMDELAYAQLYAATGKIPSGLAGAGVDFGRISEIARDMPKPAGSVVNTTTGVTPANVNATQLEGYGVIKDIIEKSERLAELNEQRSKGLLTATAGRVFGSDRQQEYLDLRQEIVDLLSRARTGAALTASEERFYAEQLPGVRAEPFFGAFTPNTTDRIRNNFKGKLEDTLSTKLETQGLTMYGFSRVDVGGEEYTVGEILTNANGQQGIVNPDGTITLVGQ